MYCWNTVPVGLDRDLRRHKAALSQQVNKDLIPALPSAVVKLPDLSVFDPPLLQSEDKDTHSQLQSV